jgi:UDP-glucose 4-epimerase
LKILVTGGAGFVGSNLCERLAADPSNTVVSLDNYSTGSKNNHVPNVKYIDMDTKDINTLEFKPDMIYHLGEYSRVEQSFEDVKTVWEYNMEGTFQVLQFARTTGAKLLYAGSSTKFGDNGPNSSPYAFTKSTNTQLVQNFAEWYGIEYAITYFYNVYGHREIATGKYATLIALFMEKYKKGEKLTVVSPGTQKRNFTHIDDIVDGLVLVGAHGQGDGYGIGSPQTYTILGIANLFGTEVEMLPERAGNRMTADVMTTKTRLLGWSPKCNVEDYIKDFIKGLRS